MSRFLKYPLRSDANCVEIHSIENKIHIIGSEEELRKTLESLKGSKVNCNSGGAEGVLYMLDNYQRV